MTQEALRLALEALKFAYNHCDSDWVQNEKINPAITAIKEALAQTQEPDDIASILACRDMLDAQPVPPRTEQEPVAWRNAAIRVGEDLSSVGPDGYYDMTAQQWLDWALSVVTVHAPPPQRTWVGLDHQDKKKFSSWLDHKTDDEVFTAIDDLLREMNT